MGCRASCQSRMENCPSRQAAAHKIGAVRTGRLQYFFHSPSSTLPIRDVLNEQGQGRKKEPHIEIGAENYWDCCYQPNNIIPLINNNERYLFLMTTCRNRSLGEFYGIKFIVGYIEVKQHHWIRPSGDNGHYAWEISFSLKTMFGLQPEDNHCQGSGTITSETPYR